MMEVELIEAIGRVADMKDNFDAAAVGAHTTPGEGPLDRRIKFVVVSLVRAMNSAKAASKNS